MKFPVLKRGHSKSTDKMNGVSTSKKASSTSSKLNTVSASEKARHGKSNGVSTSEKARDSKSNAVSASEKARDNKSNGASTSEKSISSTKASSIKKLNAVSASEQARESKSNAGASTSKKARSAKKKVSYVTSAAAIQAAAEEIVETIIDQGRVPEEYCANKIREKTRIVGTIHKHFPGAMGSSQVLNMVKPVIERRGFTDDNTLFAQSVCPDEINHEDGDIPNLFADYLGEVFHLGGLGGIPFCGKTGFAAFSHHVPDDGHCFVLMAPHIGLSDSEKLGKYTRDGQNNQEGNACGATVGAFQHCLCGEPMPALEDASDYQMNYIIREMDKRIDSILDKEGQNTQQAAIAQNTYEIAKTMLDNIVSTNFGGERSTLVVLTGIQINMPRPFEDFFQPLTFEMHTKSGEVIDLFEETFEPEKSR